MDVELTSALCVAVCLPAQMTALAYRCPSVSQFQPQGRYSGTETKVPAMTKAQRPMYRHREYHRSLGLAVHATAMDANATRK